MLVWAMTEITNELMYEVLKALRSDMAELKRDNGIMAYYNDMFELARRNLDEAWPFGITIRRLSIITARFSKPSAARRKTARTRNRPI